MRTNELDQLQLKNTTPMSRARSGGTLPTKLRNYDNNFSLSEPKGRAAIKKLA